MIGYDYWPIYCVLTTFIGMVALLKNQKYENHILFFTGLLSGITIWFRELTLLLPIFISFFLSYYFIIHKKYPLLLALKKIFLYSLPLILYFSGLVYYRYISTGNLRPTRSTFWHSFMLGVGQHNNPLGLCHNDTAIWNFAKSVNPKLKMYSLGEMYKSPNSEYEITLKAEAIKLIKTDPFLLIRNAFFKSVMIISPLFYTDGSFIKKSFLLIYPIASILLLLWFLGIYNLFRLNKLLCYIILSFFLYFTLTFCWFEVVGRIMLCFVFLHVLVYIYGILLLYQISLSIVNKKSRFK